MSVVRVESVVPAYCHPSSEKDDVKVAYTSAQPTVTAMSRTQANMDKMGIDITNVEVSEELKSFTLEYTSNDYIQDFKQAKDYESLLTVREKARAEENQLRQVYAKKTVLKDLPLLKEKYPLLVPAFGNEDIFSYKPLYPEDKEIPKVFPLEKNRKKEGSSIVDRAGFETNWRIFSERLLDLINWDHVFVAGGSILACLLPPPPKATKNFKCLRKYFHEDAYAGSDIDLYLYGLNEEEGKEKLKEIYEAVCNEIPYPVIAFRSAYAISIVSEFPYRHIQIILRLYSSPAEILMGFDVDSCSCGFDGKQVYMTPRCHQALVRQMNTVDMTRRSPTYEMRLAKYADRGFEVEVPSLKREKIDPMIFEKPWDDVRGLAKLLLLEKLRTPEARYAYRERSSGDHSMESYKMRRMMNDPFLQKRLEYSNEKASDYSTVFLPWGPNWKAKKIRKLMMTKDIVLNSEWSEAYGNRGYHTHPCFVGTLEEVLEDCCGECPPIPADVNHEELECFVSGPLSFIVDDPGRQSIGSFHPITDGDWSDGAYLSRDGELLVAAANAGDLDVIQELLQKKVIVDTPDCLGRTALHLAVLSNQVKAAEILLDAGADPTLHLKDGRSIIHIAAEYGHLDMLAMLLTKLKLLKKESQEGEQITCEMDLDEENKQTQFTALHYAVLFGHVDCAEFLLQNGATCDRMIWSSDKSTGVAVMVLAAHCECFNRQVAIDMYELLHRYGASLKLMDKQYNNVLHQLCQFNYIGFVTYLLDHDPLALALCSDINISAQTPLQVAIANKFYSLAKVMIEKNVPLHPPAEAATKLNNLLRKEGRKNYYGTRSVEIQDYSLLSNMVQAGITSDAGYDFFKFLIEKGEDVNLIHSNQTVMDVILQSKCYLTDEEYLKELECNLAGTEKTLEVLEQELKEVPEDSYRAYVLKQLYRQTRESLIAGKKGYKLQVASWQDRKEYSLKLYKLVDEHGGKMFLELYMTDAEVTEKYKKANTRQRTVSVFGSRPQYNEFDTTRCVTVVKKQVLRGEERLKALSKQSADDMENQHKTQRMNVQHHCQSCYDDIKIANEPTPYGWRNETQVDHAAVDSYLDLFEAVWSDNLEKVRSLCSPDKESKVKCVLTCYGANYMSPLSIAVNRGNKEMINLIFELLNTQFTPIPIKKEVNKSGKISNYALVTGDYGETESFVDPNADMSVIINTVEPDIVFTKPAIFNMKENAPYVTYAIQNNNVYNGYYDPFNDMSFGMNEMEIDPKTGLPIESKEEEEEDKRIQCSILEYLVYRGDVNFMSFVLEHLKVLSEQVFEKQVKANIKKEEDRNSMIINRIITSNITNNWGQYTEVNLEFPCVMNDNMNMLRVINQYTMCGLQILRDEDVKVPEKKVITRRITHVDDDDECEEDCDSYDESYDDEDDDDKKMEVEEGNENDEEIKEEEEEEEEKEESEYADSDEEEMEALRAFKKDGRRDQPVRLQNVYHPALVALRYNAIHCLRYVLDSKRVCEDIQAYASKYSSKATKIEEAGGVEAVVERVFSLKYEIKKDHRLYLQAATACDDVDAFICLSKEIIKNNEDMNQLVKRSKKYSSLLEYCCDYHHFNIAKHLLSTYKFNEKEILASYSSLINGLVTMNIANPNPSGMKTSRCLTKCRASSSRSTKKSLASSNIEIYKNIMSMILLIPAEYKDKVLTEALDIAVHSGRSGITGEIIEVSHPVITDYSNLLTNVENMSPDMFKLLLECTDLKNQLMKENPRGYTVVEEIMKQYMKDASSGQAVRNVKNDEAIEMEKKMEVEEEEKSEMEKLFKNMQVDTRDRSKLLGLALEASSGLKRELTTIEEVQKRVKKDAEEASAGNRWNRRAQRSYISNGNQSFNARSAVINQLCAGEKKN